jgi:hypothetical protein
MPGFTVRFNNVIAVQLLYRLFIGNYPRPGDLHKKRAGCSQPGKTLKTIPDYNFSAL